MKFMRLGARPDTFYTEEATRSIVSDLPSDLTIRINSITYLLHKLPLVPKCGLLQRLGSDWEDSTSVTLELHDIPGGEDAFELCAKFCYGITINLSAHNFVPALCAAKFLGMTESVQRGNFVSKLETFFNSCILQGWKDSIVTLQATGKLPEWSENLGIIRRCIDSIVEKILTPPQKVRWPFTYTRPGYAEKKHHRSAPKDWWTEDIADLDIDLFRCIVNTLRSTNLLPPRLIGEALHVYACRWLPDVMKNRPHPETSTASQTTEEESVNRKRQLETIVGIIPEDIGSVSVAFLLRLLSTANLLGASPVIKTQLIRQASLQLEEASTTDLLLPLHHPSDNHQRIYDTDLVKAVLESFNMQWRRQASFTEHQQQSLDPIIKVQKLVDSYLQVVSRDVNMPVDKFVSLAKTLPEFSRPQHDNLYKAINIYLKEHPQMSKEEKKRLCSVLDCQKLSPAVCTHVVKNERLPLRTVIQVLFFDQERSGNRAITGREVQQSETQPRDTKAATRCTTPRTRSQKLEPELANKSRRKKVVEKELQKGREIVEEE